MKPEYIIRNARNKDVRALKDLIFPEEWNIGAEDIDFFVKHYANNLYVGEIDGKIISCLLGLEYNPELAFFGMYVVDPNYRKQKYGIQLALHVLEHTKSKIWGNDGVMEQVDSYKRNGFKTYHNNIRLSGKAKVINHTKMHEFVTVNGEIPKGLLDLDYQCFRTNRAPFIKKWLDRKDIKAICHKNIAGHIDGFGMIRPAQKGYVIGPIYAETYTIFQAIINKFLAEIEGKEFYIEVPEINPYFGKIKKEYGLEESFTMARMYTSPPKEIAIKKVFANMCNISG